MLKAESLRLCRAAIPSAQMRPLLFDYRAVGLATCPGTPLGGAVLMARNYRRLENSAAAVWILLMGAAGSGLVLWIAIDTKLLVFKFVPLALILGMMALAKALQGGAVERHVDGGGRLESKWTAAGVGLVVWVFVMLIAWVVVKLPTFPP